MRRPSGPARLLRAWRPALLAAWAALASPAAAHHAGGGPTSGLSIPGLAHGQMEAVAAHRDAILALADRQHRTDPTFRRLRNFVALQHAACLYGWAPGSVTDEDSPFNECAHADLAAVRALLDHLAGLPDSRAEARRLADGIDAAWAAGGGAAVLCRFSDEPFDTAAVIGPDWRKVPLHPPTAMALFGLLALAVSGGALLRRGAAPGADVGPG